MTSSKDLHIDRMINEDGSVTIIEDTRDSSYEEIIKEADVIFSSSADVIDAFSSTDTLSKVYDTLSENKNNPSLETVRMCQKITELTYNRLNLDASRVFPVMECFESIYERKQAYEVSMEGILDGIKKIWKAIVEAIRKIWQRIKDFMYKLFGTIPKLKREIEKLQREISETRSTPRVTEFVDQKIIDAFSIERRVTVDTVMAILSNHANISNDINRISEQAGIINERITEACDTINGSISSIKLRYINMFPEASSGGLNQNQNGSRIATETQNGEHVSFSTIIDEVYVSAVRGIDAQNLGNVIKEAIINSLNLQQITLPNKDIFAISLTPYVLGKQIVLYERSEEDRSTLGLEIEDQPERELPEKAITLLKNEMTTILSKADQLLKVMDGNKKAMNKLSDIDRNMHKALKEVMNVLDGIDVGTDNMLLKQRVNSLMMMVKPSITSFVSMMNRVYTGIPLLNLEAAKNAVYYVKMSYKQYG